MATEIREVEVVEKDDSFLKLEADAFWIWVLVVVTFIVFLCGSFFGSMLNEIHMFEDCQTDGFAVIGNHLLSCVVSK